MDFHKTEQSAAVMELRLQQLLPSSFHKIDNFNLQTMGMGPVKYTSHEFQMQHATTQHHASPLLP